MLRNSTVLKVAVDETFRDTTRSRSWGLLKTLAVQQCLVFQVVCDLINPKILK